MVIGTPPAQIFQNIENNQPSRIDTGKVFHRSGLPAKYSIHCTYPERVFASTVFGPSTLIVPFRAGLTGDQNERVSG
jgi:hypothetical protein